MRRLVVCLIVSCLVLLLTSCSSAPTHFYTLLAPASASGSSPGSAAYDIAVLPVTIPAQVDRPQMVIREGGGSVALLEGEQWIAPLGDEIRSAISSALTHRLGSEDVYGLAHAAYTPVYRVNVDVRRFDSVPGQYTFLAAAWSVHAKADKGVALSCTSRVRETVGTGYAALAQGHQRGLYQLAGDIAVVIQSMARGAAARCPT